jgi:hypothetical protein
LTVPDPRRTIAEVVSDASHPADDLLELYSLGRVTDPRLARVEEHLLVCDRCRERLTEIDSVVETVRSVLQELQDVPLDLSHHTEVGKIRLLVVETASGHCHATFAGQQLDGGRRFATIAEANQWILESFRLMFPEHKCDERCNGKPRPSN